MIRWLLLGSLCCLVGCKGNAEAIQPYVDAVKERPPEVLEAIPDLDLETPFLYSAQKLKDPFESFEKQHLLPPPGGIAPPVDRPKEPLESFSLDALRMVGTIEKKQKIWAIFLDSDNLIYRAGIGSYVGNNYGQVTQITEKSVKLREIVPDERGGWAEREAEIALTMQ